MKDICLFYSYIRSERDKYCWSNKQILGSSQMKLTCWRTGLPFRWTSTGWRNWFWDWLVSRFAGIKIEFWWTCQHENTRATVYSCRPAACWGALPATGGSSEVIPPLHWDLVKPYLKSWVQFWPPQCQRKTLTYWNKPTEIEAWWPRTWSTLHKRRGCSTHLFCLRKRKISNDLTIAFSYFMGADRHKLTLPQRGEQGPVQLSCSKENSIRYTKENLQHWRWGFRGVVNPPSLEIGSALNRWPSEPFLTYIIHQFCDIIEESIDSACWSYTYSTLILYIHNILFTYYIHSLNTLD